MDPSQSDKDHWASHAGGRSRVQPSAPPHSPQGRPSSSRPDLQSFGSSPAGDGSLHQSWFDLEYRLQDGYTLGASLTTSALREDQTARAISIYAWDGYRSARADPKWTSYWSPYEYDASFASREIQKISRVLPGMVQQRLDSSWSDQ